MGTPRVDTTLRNRRDRDGAAEEARLILSAGDVEQSMKILLENGCSPYSANAIQMRAMLALRKAQYQEADKYIAQSLKVKRDAIGLKMAGDSAFLQCDFTLAEKRYREALELKPDGHEIWHDLAVAIVSQGRVNESLAFFNHACELAPDRADYKHHLSLMMILDGQDAAGWDWMQHRLNVQGVCGMFPKPEKYWRGEPLAGKTIVLRTEQGWGDAFLFSGYLPWLIEQAGKVYVFCQRALLPWFEHYFPGAHMWPNDAPPPLDFDYHVNIMCLPRLVPAEAYRAPKRKLTAGEGIGINWFGSPTHKADHLRTVPIERFGPLAQAAGRTFKCLGYGRFDQKPPFVEYVIDGARDWLETSRIVENLDLIITVDTAIAHLGGFLGVETWLLLPYVPDFRWKMSGERTPWYESLKLYRQPKLFDWDSVFARVAEDLRARYSA